MKRYLPDTLLEKAAEIMAKHPLSLTGKLKLNGLIMQDILLYLSAKSGMIKT